jgi:hypothetical protein
LSPSWRQKPQCRMPISVSVCMLCYIRWLIIIIIIIFNLHTAAFKAYCAIWVRRSNFRHQASPRVSPRESTQRRKMELWARNVREFCLNADLHVILRDLLHAVMLRHYFPSEGKRVEDFFALKIRQLRPGANPRTWVPRASTLLLDHRSRYIRWLTVSLYVLCRFVDSRILVLRW